MPNEALQRRLEGMKDSRGMQGIMSRGANVYKGGAPQARTGGGANIGRPPVNSPELSSAQPPQGGEPSLSDIVQKMIQMQAPETPQYSLQGNEPIAPGNGGVGGGVGMGSAMAVQQNSNPMMPGMPGVPPQNAIARRLGVR